MKYKPLFGIFCLVILSQVAFGTELRCQFDASPVVIQENAKQYAAVWTLKNEKKYWSSDFEWDAEDIEYSEWAKKSFPNDFPYNPVNILLKHIEIIKEHVEPGPKKEKQLRYLDRSLALLKSHLRKPNCIEMFLHRNHNHRFSLKEATTEFYGEVLKSPDGKELKVYSNSDTYLWGGATPGPLKKLIEEDIEKGWQRELSLHNHPLVFGSSTGDYGPITPSSGDLRLYAEQGFRRAVITDGLHSFEMSRDQYLWIDERATQKDFEQVLQEFKTTMTDFAITAYEGRMPIFQVIGDWSKEYSRTSGGAGFYTDPREGKMGVYIQGWVARWFDRDGMSGVLCHELGHHFYGGHAEQQADYFVTKTCLRKLWKENFSHERALAAVNQFHGLREWIWEKWGIPSERAQRITKCRKKILMDGLLEKPFEVCEDERSSI